jgi:hypothetical protein
VNVLTAVASTVMLAGSVLAAPVPPLAPLGFMVKFVQVLPDADPYRATAYRRTEHRHRQAAPDGRTLLVTRFASCGQQALCSYLWLERQGHPPLLIHRHAAWMQWNRRGSGFAFVGRRRLDRAYPQSLYVYTLDPLRELRRIDIDPIDYTWSPLGGTLAIVGRWGRDAGRDALPAGADERRPLGVFLAPAHGDALRLVDRVPARRDARIPGAWWTPDVPGISWSPDGRFVVYSVVQSAASHGETYAADLFIATADGRWRQQLTQTPWIVETWPRWVAVDQIVTLRTHMRVVGMRPRRIPVLEADRREGAVLNIAVPR